MEKAETVHTTKKKWEEAKKSFSRCNFAFKVAMFPDWC